MKNAFEDFYHEDCVTLYSQNLPNFPSFPVIFSKINNNAVYPFFTFMVINKVNLSFIQKSGFIEDIKQNKSVQIFLPPLSGHGDCATDQTGCPGKAGYPV